MLTAWIDAKASKYQHLINDTIKLESVTVRQKAKSPYLSGKNISKISTTEIANSSVNNIGEIVLRKNSIYSQQQGRGGAMYLSIRGTGKSHTEVTWNGIPLASSMYGTTDFSLIPTEVIDQASIFYGGSATGISSSNIGGAVTLNTFPYYGDSLKGKFNSSIGSFHTYKASANLKYAISNRFSATSKAYYSSSKNDFTFVNKYKVVPNEDKTAWVNPTETNHMGDWETYGVVQELFYRFSPNTKLSFHYWGQYNNRSIPTLATDSGNDIENNKENRSKTLSHRGSLVLRTLLNEWNLQLLSAINYEKSHYWNRDNQTQYTFYDDLSKGTNSYNKISVYRQLDPNLSLRFNMQYNLLHINSNNRTNSIVVEKTRQQKIAFGNISYNFNDWISSSFSLQSQWNEDRYSGIIPCLGASFELIDDKKLTISTQINRNYRFPTLKDQYSVPGGNPDLKEEKGWAYSLAFDNEISTRKLDIHNLATLYYSNIDNWIEWKPSEFGFWEPTNRERVLAYGVELSNQILWTINPKASLSSLINYNYARTINKTKPKSPNDKSYNKQLPYTPQHILSTTLQGSYKRWDLLCTWIVNSKQFSTSSNDTSNSYGTIDGYHYGNVDLKYHHKIKRQNKLTYTLSIMNVTNTTYESLVAQPMPGINFQFSIDYEF